MKYFIIFVIVLILQSCSDSSNQPSIELEGKIVILHHNVVKGIIEDTDSIDINQGSKFKFKLVFNQEVQNDTLCFQITTPPGYNIVSVEDYENYSGKEFFFYTKLNKNGTYLAQAYSAKYYPINGVISRTFSIFNKDTFNIEG